MSNIVKRQQAHLEHLEGYEDYDVEIVLRPKQGAIASPVEEPQPPYPRSSTGGAEAIPHLIALTFLIGLVLSIIIPIMNRMEVLRHQAEVEAARREAIERTLLMIR